MTTKIATKRLATLGALTAATVLLVACGSNPKVAGPANDSAGPGSGAASDIPQQKKDAALFDALPAKIKTAGKLVSVNSGSFPPYDIIGSDGKSVTGASADLAQALSQVIGVKIEEATVDGLASELAGISAGRYDFALGPIGDFKSRQESADFVDWVREFVVFAVSKGNPKGIKSIADTCGLRVSVMAAGSAEKVIKDHSAECIAQGKKKVDVQSYKDQPSALLAVSSRRADAFFSSQAPLTYFTQHSNGALELAGTGQSNGFDDLYQGAVVPKGSPLGDVLMKAMKTLIANGTYKAVMDKWALKANEIPQPGMNLSTS